MTIYFLLTLCGLLNGAFGGSEENVLLKKPVIASDYQKYANNSNDGDKTTCMWLRPNNVLYAVFDLKNTYQITSISFTSGQYRGNTPFSIYLADEVSLCHLHDQIKQFKLCKSGIIQNAEDLSIQCNDDSAVGRYLILYKGDVFATTETEELNYCEIAAFGNFVSVAKDFVRPQIASIPVNPVTRKDFAFIDSIRQNIPEAVVPSYAKGLVKINKKCEPIIWDKTWNLTFALACVTNNDKGRALIFGKEWYFWYATNDADKKNMKEAFLKWLSPNKANPNILLTDKISTVNDLRKKLTDGDIIDFVTTKNYSKEFTDEIASLLQNGKISLVIDHNNYGDLDPDAQKSMYRLLDLFNVDFDDTYFTFSSSGKYTVNNDDFVEYLLDVEDKLQRFFTSHEYFMKNGLSFSKELTKIPAKLQAKATNLANIYRKIAEKYKDLVDFICPCKASPATDPKDRLILQLIGSFVKNQGLAGSNFKMPCIDLFPGDFLSPPAKKDVLLEIYGDVASTRNPLGYYLEAGSTASYSVESKSGSWYFSVGCHSDVLEGNRPEWYRYPDIYVDKVTVLNEGYIYSPYGGALWITNEVANSSIRITLKSVVSSPFFNIHDPNAVETWEKRRKDSPGLWAQTAGEDMVLCGESSKVRIYSGENIKTLMKSWDKVVRNNHAYVSEDWRQYRPEQAVLDIMTSFGYAHSGYPVSTWDDWYLNIFNYTYITTKGSWGMCHELGHNRQKETWTFAAVSETTNNIFCLLNFEKVWKLPYYGKTLESISSASDTAKTFLDKGAPYAEWADSSTLTLFIYIQMANHFGLGFHAEYFRYYIDNNINPGSDNEKRDFWFKISSKVAGQNLIPLFDFWGIPISSNVVESLKELPCFLPDDYFVNLSNKRKQYILSKYSKCNRKSSYYRDFDVDKYNQGHRPNFIKEVQVTEA